MKIAVLGCGTMGSGIAQIAATNHCETVLYDISESALEQSRVRLERILNRLIEKGRIDETTKQNIQDNITYSTNLKALAGSNLVIEAIIEDVTIKSNLFKAVQDIVDDQCIMASNTSSLSITALAASIDLPSRFIGIHFFNPAPLMKLVEIVPAIQTDKAVTNRCIELINSWGKHTVVVKDTPGFIVNKVARPFYSEALRIFEEGLAGNHPEQAFATIDWAMTTIAGFRMGPFTLMDFIGNDINYKVTKTVFEAFYYDPRYKPAFTQKRLSEAGFLGRKSGRGYYNYDSSHEKAAPNQDPELGQMIADRIVIMLINEAADTLQFNIASKADIDTAMTKGVNYPKALFIWADEIGIEECVARMDRLYNHYREDRYRCSALLRNMADNKETFYD